MVIYILLSFTGPIPLGDMQEKPARYSCSQALRAGFIQLSGGSDSQNLAATTTTGSQDTTAILGGHTGAEAVHLAALTLLGLVSTEHRSTLLTISQSGKIPNRFDTAFILYRFSLCLSRHNPGFSCVIAADFLSMFYIEGKRTSACLTGRQQPAEEPQRSWFLPRADPPCQSDRSCRWHGRWGGAGPGGK